jgi:hypothetical protein
VKTFDERVFWVLFAIKFSICAHKKSHLIKGRESVSLLMPKSHTSIETSASPCIMHHFSVTPCKRMPKHIF